MGAKDRRRWPRYGRGPGKAAAGGGGGGGAAQEKSPAEAAIAAAGAAKAPEMAAGGGGLTVDKMETAFDASRGANNNFVTLEDFRNSLGGTRAEQDAVIRQGRLAGKFSLDSHEGMHGAASPGMRGAAIHEGPESDTGYLNPATGKRVTTEFIWISRR